MKEVNGIDTDALSTVIESFKEADGRSEFVFRTRTRWLGGGHSKTTIKGFSGAFQEHDSRQFELEADEPRVLLGADSAPNPVEHLLQSLAACLTGSMAYHAAARGIEIHACECTLRGEIDIRGFLGVAPEVRRGFRHIEVRFQVESDAPAGKLSELARFSPVLDVVQHGTVVDLQVETIPIKAEAPA
ncbi:MAG: OsmC family protein [Pseudomonadota bacterium]|nr:OsmC family protein [Pseudomonadota bacterium]